MTVLLCASLLRTRWCELNILDECIRCLGTLRRPRPKSHPISSRLRIPILTLLWRGILEWSARRVLQHCGGRSQSPFSHELPWRSNELLVASQYPATASVFIG
uniref:Uncharacterized protein n=1 Tax=Hyaloperonospora arabidopsidis (strain Emoy2) TaxID=559515 RepID=M4BJ89_HYAAE